MNQHDNLGELQVVGFVFSRVLAVCLCLAENDTGEISRDHSVLCVMPGALNVIQ